MYEKTDIKKASTYVYERKWKLLYNICMQLLLTVHAHQEFVVVFGLLQTVFYEVHGFYRIHVGKVLAENPHAVQCLLVLQQVVAAGAGGNDVDSREDTLVGQVAVELQLMLPVPLNSSKITSSILEPVSINAVAIIVSEPPFSILRAAPKKRLGL